VTSSVRFTGKPPARFNSSNLPASCMAVASRNWKASWTLGGWALRREAKVGGQREHRMGTAYPVSRRPLNQAAISEMVLGRTASPSAWRAASSAT